MAHNIDVEIARVKGRLEVIGSLQKFMRKYISEDLEGDALKIIVELGNLVDVEVAKNEGAINVIGKVQ